MKNFKQRLQAKQVGTKDPSISSKQIVRTRTKRVYLQMNGTSSSFNEARPDAKDSPQFWREIWHKEVLHSEKE